jgi:aminoglycoside phosphotransferase
MIEDALLPAAAHLTGPSAPQVIGAAIAASGGRLVACRPSQVQYRPHSDLVVRYRCEVRRDGATVHDTVLAGTTAAGRHPGTVPVEAVALDGTTLSVGVWRWPFDPILPDLVTMAAPDLAGEQLASLVGARPHLEVVAYRPTERAVIRVDGPHRRLYVKIVPPAATEALAMRHERLAAAGVPVPRVLATGSGWIAMSALDGTTLRDRLKGGDHRLPSPDRYLALLDVLATVELPVGTPLRSRIEDAPHHAAMLGTVLPGARQRLTEIVDRLAAEPLARRLDGTVHGDLHEAQLVVDDRSVIGLLDVDDAGPGDPLDDIAALLGHLRFRAVSSGDQRIDTYADRLRAAVPTRYDRAVVDRHVAAVLVGLATGPFRIQQADWATTTHRVLDLVDDHLDATA